MFQIAFALLTLLLLRCANLDPNSDYDVDQKPSLFKSISSNDTKIKMSKGRVLYYANSTASFRLILSGDIR